MTSRKIVAVFDTQEAAQAARESLMSLGLPRERITVTDQGSSERTVHTQEARGGLWAHIKEMFMPDSDRYTIEESMRRGSCVLVATVEDDLADAAIERLDRAGAIDLADREAQWRAAGWNPDSSEAQPQTTAEREPIAEQDAGSNVAGERAGEAALRARGENVAGDTVPVVEERLRVGKREVNRGSVRVRSYIVEEPVHEEVRLREEHVDVERRPVDAPVRPVVKGSPGDLMQERTIEVSETAEQAVVGKEARVTEEVVVSKTADERVEQIDDTVRRTEVEIEDGREGARPGRSKVRNPTPQRPGPGRT
jgi:uncharacterized protein (TIGR02271 family)